MVSWYESNTKYLYVDFLSSSGDVSESFNTLYHIESVLLARTKGSLVHALSQTRSANSRASPDRMLSWKIFKALYVGAKTFDIRSQKGGDSNGRGTSRDFDLQNA